MIVIDSCKCNLCKECILVCPKHCRYPEDGVMEIVSEVCANCEYCLDVCPNDAIQVII